MTSHARKGKKKKAVARKRSAKPEQKQEELTIIDRAKGEKEMGLTAYSLPEGKKYTREVFKLWLALPDQFKGAQDRIIALLGITDPIALELLQIPTMRAFAEEFGVIPQTLSRWRGELEDDSDFLRDVKKSMRKTTRNVLGALYRKVIEEGDAPRVMAWMKIVEDWREQLGVEVTDAAHTDLSPEEMAKLDKLIERNSVKA